MSIIPVIVSLQTVWYPNHLLISDQKETLVDLEQLFEVTEQQTR